MKTNEAPMKIYLQKYDTDTLLCLNRYNIHEEWTERPVCGNSASGNDIEYIRTDAFIEKAANWLRCHPSSHYDDLEEFANAFKKAMKL